MEKYFLIIMGENGELQIKQLTLSEAVEYGEKQGYSEPARLNLMAGDKCLIATIKGQTDKYRLIKII